MTGLYRAALLILVYEGKGGEQMVTVRGMGAGLDDAAKAKRASEAYRWPARHVSKCRACEGVCSCHAGEGSALHFQGPRW